jgi:hypothetical protein
MLIKSFTEEIIFRISLIYLYNVIDSTKEGNRRSDLRRFWPFRRSKANKLSITEKKVFSLWQYVEVKLAMWQNTKIIIPLIINELLWRWKTSCRLYLEISIEIMKLWFSSVINNLRYFVGNSLGWIIIISTSSIPYFGLK